MRQQLINAFTDIYILDLHGHATKEKRAPDGNTDRNVFDIRQGVAIGIFVKEPGKTGPAKVHHAHLWGTREAKYEWLAEHTVEGTCWTELDPLPPFYLFVPQDTEFKTEYEEGWKITDVMGENGDPAPGIVTTHDQFAISWSRDEAKQKVARLLQTAFEEEARSL